MSDKRPGRRLPNLHGLKIRRYRNRQGRCFELAGNCLMDSDESSDWRLVHGEIDNLNSSRRMTHAWLRRGDLVYDPVLNEFHHEPRYARAHNAVARATFSKSETAKMVLSQRHWGPWDGQPMTNRSTAPAPMPSAAAASTIATDAVARNSVMLSL